METLSRLKENYIDQIDILEEKVDSLEAKLVEKIELISRLMKEKKAQAVQIAKLKAIAKKNDLMDELTGIEDSSENDSDVDNKEEEEQVDSILKNGGSKNSVKKSQLGDSSPKKKLRFDQEAIERKEQKSDESFQEEREEETNGEYETPHKKKEFEVNEATLLDSCSPNQALNNYEDELEEEKEVEELETEPKLIEMKFLQEFLIIGVDQKTREDISMMSTLNVIQFRVKHLLSYPESEYESRSIQMANFTSPFEEKKQYDYVEPSDESFKKLFRLDKSCQERLFFIALNSQVEGSSKYEHPVSDAETEEILKLYNPNKFYYYFCLDIGDFIFKDKLEGGSLAYIEIPKIICIKSLMPRKEFYYQILSDINDFICRMRYESTKELNYGELNGIKFGFEDHETLGSPNSHATKLIADMINTRVTSQNLKSVKFPLSNSNYSLDLPDSDYAWHIEGDNGIDTILDRLSLDEVLLLFFAVLKEVAIVFISENREQLSSCISFFSSLIKPFQWPHPSIYSLPEELLIILQSPVPFIVGLKLSSYIFDNNFKDMMLKNQSNSTLLVYLDDHIITPHNITFEDIKLPSFSKKVYKFKKTNERMHSMKKSRFLRIEKKKHNKKEHFRFHTRSKPDKKSKRQSVNPKYRGRSSKYDYQYFFFNLIKRNITTPLEDKNEEVIDDSGRLNLPAAESILLENTEEEDHEFLKELIHSQTFAYFFENKF